MPKEILPSCPSPDENSDGSDHAPETGKQIPPWPQSDRILKCTQGLRFVAGILYNAAQQRAKRYKVPFSLTRAEVEDMLREAGEKCPALKVEFCRAGRYTQPSAQFSRTLHRVKAEYGYQRANVRVVTWRANRLCALYTSGAEARQIGEFMDISNAEVQAAIDRGELLPPSF